MARLTCVLAVSGVMKGHSDTLRPLRVAVSINGAATGAVASRYFR